MNRIILLFFLLAVSLIPLRAQQTSWQWVNPLPQGNLLNAVYTISPETAVAVGEMGTILRTTDGGVTWQVEHSVAGIEDQFLAVSFVSGTTGWVVGEYGVILKTTDGGATWSGQYSSASQDLFAVFFVSPTVGWVAGSSGTMFKTTDGGGTWAPETTHATSTLFGLYFKSSTLGWAVGTSGTILQTTNGGAAWTSLPTGSSQTFYSISFPTASLGYAVGSFGTILRSVNGGASWTPTTSPTDLTLYGLQFVNATTGWAAGSYGAVLKTTNAGTDWFIQSTPTFNDLYGVSFAPGSSVGIAVGDYGTMVKTTDGTNWTSITTGVKYELYASHFRSPMRAYSVGDLGTIAMSSDGGRSWTKQASGTFKPLFGVYFLTDLLGWCVGDSASILRTTNGGAIWLEQNSHTDPALYSIYFATSSSGWAVGDFGTILATTNGGLSWLPETSHTSATLVRVKFATTSIGWAVGYGGTILKTTNGGGTWVTQSSGTPYTLNGLEVIDQNNAVVVGDVGTIISTTNGGATWTPRISNADENFLGVTFFNSQIGWAAGDEGIVVGTFDGGVTWSPQPTITSHPFFEIQAVHASSGGVVVATGYGGTLISAAISPLPLHVWTGAVDSSWYSGGNWNPVGVPTKVDSVYIPASAVNPVIQGSDQEVMIGALTIGAGARLTVRGGIANMVVKSNVTMLGTFEFDPSVHTQILIGGNFLTLFDGQFIPGGSTVEFTAPGQVKGTFNNLVLGPNALMQTTGNIAIRNNFDIFSNLLLRSIDTLTILNSDPGAFEGPGIVKSGTIKRAVLSGSTTPYRFESAVTYLRFYPTGTLPDTISMTVNPNALPPGLPDTLFARRFYTMSAIGGSNYLAMMSLRYDSAESKIGIDDLSLFLDSSGILFNMGRYDFLDSDLVAVSLDSVKQLSKWYFGRWDYYPLRPYEFTDSLMITDNGNILDTLVYGAVDGATDEIDTALGEVVVGPRPPLGTFDARWVLPTSKETQVDIRPLLSSSNQQRTYTGVLQPGPGGYPMAVRWKKADLPAGSFFIRDQATHGNLFTINMKQEELVLITGSSMSTVEIVHTIPSFYTVYAGWNMVSLPLKPSNDARLVNTFPSATSEAFGYNAGYYLEDTLHVGRGYWLRFGSLQTVGLEGTTRTTDSIPVVEGWNMIGAGSKSIAKASIIQSPPGIVISNYFQFQNGYTSADSLMPSRAYWVKTSGGGTLVLKSNGALPKETESDASAAELQKLNTLIITDHSGNQQTLYFGVPPTTSFRDEFFQMPPAPPAEAFDVRFTSGSMVTIGTGHGVSETAQIQATAYPVTMRWSFRQQRVNVITFTNPASGKVLYYSESGTDGSLELTDPGITRIRFAAEMNPVIPEHFSLKQNYPNPFNPSTSIVFDLPVDALVTLRVYNLLGQEVAVLLENQLYAAGTHSSTFDASRLGSGVYFYRCIAHGVDRREFMESRKMLLLK